MNLRQWLSKTDMTVGEVASHLSVTINTIRRWADTGVPISRQSDVSALSDGEVKFTEAIPAPIKGYTAVHDAILQLEEYVLWLEDPRDRAQIQHILEQLYRVQEFIRG